jgi:MFS family permease
MTEPAEAERGPAEAERGPAEAAGIRTTWRSSPPAVKALVVGVLVQRLGAFIQVFLVLFLTQRGFTPVEAGLVLGVYGAGSIVGVLVGGELADRLGPRLTMVGSLVGTAPLLVGLLYLPHYAGLLVIGGALGAVSQAFRPAATTMLSVLTPRHRLVMIFAMVRLATNLGTTAAPLIGAALVTLSYDLLFWVEAVVVLGYAAIVAAAVPARYPAQVGADGEAAGGGGGGGEPADDRRAGYRSVMVDRRYLLFLLAVFINVAVYMQYVSTLPAAMRDAGLSEWWFGAVLSLNALIVVICELLVTKVVQRWQMRVAVLVGFLLLGAGLAAYALPLGVAAFVVGTLIWSAAEVIGGPTILAYPAAISPQRLRGRYIGLISATFGVGATVGPVAGLAAWELVGDQVWWWYAVVCGLGAAVAWVAMSRPAAPAGTGRGAAEPGAAEPRAAESGAAEPGAAEPKERTA